ncbi:glycosyltransferase [Lutibacter sp. HS1-25]|uniref:glycosyltransferase family 2 protein n=1 Tax=Lutibacter sp. HS1-25 TaxID=2485000 RepID=UPI00101301A7|nr:glycosyltransferase [Lutibacter sp. HS1-25]RXP52573.1 glycosyltransferase [Lutibacter sp. HS1-25]
MNKGLISFVIPCYNDAQYIDQAVNSALNQTYSPIEVIVVDDGSNTETKAILKSIEPKITKLITQENKGQSTARNVGIKEAKGNYIVTLDSDDFFEPTFCDEAIKLINNNMQIKIVTCNTTILYDEGMTELYIPNGGEVQSFIFNNCALGSSLFKKEDWESCGGYDETMRKGFEDWEFYIRILQQGGYAKVIPNTLFNYRRRANSTTARANKNKYELLNYIYTKHKELYIQNYEQLISHFLNSIKREEIEKIKNTQRIEFKIGKALLRPFRFIKALMK